MSAPTLIVTGTRAEFGLLLPVMRAVDAHPDLSLRVAVTGTHPLPPASTIDEVRAHARVDAVVPMQEPGALGRADDALALGRGVSGFAELCASDPPAWVVVLGDRIEALAAAAAASVSGVRVAHLHGGDRAAGVADDAMRHSISKLAHLHLPATDASAERLVRLGEPPEFVRTIGSTSVDALSHTAPMPDDEHAGLGAPDTVFLMHPVGRDDAAERDAAAGALAALAGRRVLALHPNHDPGRQGVLAAIRDAAVYSAHHLPRDRFLALLKRLAGTGGVLVGNSSAGLIEAAALQLPAVDIGDRQSGRERADNAVHAEESTPTISGALTRALALDRAALTHPYGDGNAGGRAAEALAAALDPAVQPRLTRKLNTY